ncbi:MAG: radical SAM protein [Patescibacteria group bacterium]
MLIMRNEKSGAVIFNNSAGIQINIDNEGKMALEKWLEKKPVSPEEKKFLSQTLLKLQYKTGDKYLKKSIDSKIPDYPFTVFNSPALVDLQITTKCNLNCPHCYANAGAGGYHLPFKDIEKILGQCAELGVLEIALGGGEPTLHPDFRKILKAARAKGIVPNLAANGFSPGILNIAAISKYAGAAALSLEGIEDDFSRRRNFSFSRFLRTYWLLKKAKVKVVFQLTVSQTNLYKLPEIIKFCLGLKPYGIVLLTYKPVGRAKSFDAPLKNEDFLKVEEILKEALSQSSGTTRFGYDCCLGNALQGLGAAKGIAIEGCSALRTSLAINANLDIVPCSFSSRVLGNFSNISIHEAWQGEKAKAWRDGFTARIQNDPACASCRTNNDCLGGCPEFSLVSCAFKK